MFLKSAENRKREIGNLEAKKTENEQQLTQVHSQMAQLVGKKDKDSQKQLSSLAGRASTLNSQNAEIDQELQVKKE